MFGQRRRPDKSHTLFAVHFASNERISAEISKRFSFTNAFAKATIHTICAVKALRLFHLAIYLHFISPKYSWRWNFFELLIAVLCAIQFPSLCICGSRSVSVICSFVFFSLFVRVLAFAGVIRHCFLTAANNACSGYLNRSFGKQLHSHLLSNLFQ